MKTKEEVEAILNDPQAEQKLDMLKVVLDGEFTREELACMFTGVVQLFVPMMNAEAFKSYCDTMRATFNNTKAELDLLEEKKPLSERKVFRLNRYQFQDLQKEQYRVKVNENYPTPISNQLSRFFGKDVYFEVLHSETIEDGHIFLIWLED